MATELPLTTVPSFGVDHLPWAKYKGTNQYFGDMHALSISPDGARIAFGCGTAYASAAPQKKSAVIVVVDVMSGAAVERLEGSRGTVHSVAFSPEGGRLASYDVRHPWSGTAGDQRAVRIWDIETGQLVTSKECGKLHNTVNWAGRSQLSSDRVVRWPCDGKIFTADGTRVGIWNEKLKALPPLELDTPALTTPREGGEDRVLAFDPTADGSRLAISGSLTGLRVEPAKGGGPLSTNTRKGNFMSVSFNPEGTLLAALEAGDPNPSDAEKGNTRSDVEPLISAARPKRVMVLSADTLEPVWSRPVDGDAQHIAFASDGASIYTADAATSRVILRQWRASDGAPIGAWAHRQEHRSSAPDAKIDPQDTVVRDLAVSGSLVAALTRHGVWFFRP